MNRFAHAWAAGVMVAGAAAAAAQQPVTLTTTADFLKGNNDGLIATAQDRVTRDRVTAGTLAAWSATTSVPTERADVSTVVYNGFVYCLGGEGAPTEVIYAPINGDGSLGSWSQTTAIPEGRRFHTSVAANGFVYVIAGYDGDYGSAFNTVFVAPINADGSVGDWTTTAPLPSARGFHASAVYNGFVYVTGGAEFGATPEVLVAKIQADGTLGDWVFTTELPANRDSHTTVAYNGFLYVLGGFQWLANTTTFYAPINEDGTVGAWNSTSEMNPGHSAHASVAYNGFIYSIGGEWVTDVTVAAINADGTLGSWSPAAPLPSTRRFLGAVAYENRLYAIGGGGLELEVFYTSVNNDAGNANQSPDRLTGYYSHLVDLGSDTATRFITLNGHVSPGCEIRLQVRLAADADAIFGAETVVDSVTPGAPIEVPGNGRYVWMRITLDDSGSQDVDDPSYVSDIAVSATEPPTGGVVLDGPGADIDSQTSKTTIQANWSGFTPGVGDTIVSYEWAIGTAPGLSNIQGWVNVGSTTSATNATLNLSAGVKYVSVRAVSGFGLVSSPAVSDGVQVQGSTATPTSGDDDDGGRCSNSAGSGVGSIWALVAGLVILRGLVRRR